MKVSTRLFVFFALALVIVTAALIAATSPVFAQSTPPPTEPEAVFWSAMIEKMALEFGPLLFAALAAWGLKELGRFWTAFRVSRPDVAQTIEQAVNIAVRAAEQAGAAGYITNKKRYATEVAQKWLETNGVKVDLNLISAAIEAAVYDEFNRFKLEPIDEIDETDEQG